MINRTILLLACIFCICRGASAQNDQPAQLFSLEDCIHYALKHQPALKQSLIDEAIARDNNLIAFSDWLPQVSGTANLQHYFGLPTVFIPDSTGQPKPIKSGLINTSTPAVSASETIFSPDVLFATRTAKLNIRLARQNTSGTRIDLVSDVSKSFYDVLLTLQQITVLKEDTARLNKNQQDAYHQYVSGIVDKVDYKQATISLNNTLAQLKTANESLQSKYATLKQYMGYPADRDFTVNFDTTQMMQEIFFDTTEELDFEKRIEYQQLMTQKRIQKETTAYYQLSFLPTLSGFYQYDYEFESNTFSDLYNRSYPYSLFGINLSIPIFTGFRRLENIHKARLQEQRIDWDVVNLKLTINAEYKQALATYKSNLYDLHAMEDNVSMAKEVYNIVKLQYREGIKAYLDVINAESDLRTSEINYLNALFQLLQSKIDLEKAMGDIPTNI